MLRGIGWNNVCKHLRLAFAKAITHTIHYRAFVFVSDRRRIGIAKLKTASSTWLCAHLSVFLYKIGCGSAIPSPKIKLLVWYCAHLSLFLYKIGCGSAIPSPKIKLLVWYCAHLSLFLYKIGCGSAIPSPKIKLLVWYCAHLSLFLYLKIMQLGKVTFT